MIIPIQREGTTATVQSPVKAIPTPAQTTTTIPTTLTNTKSDMWKDISALTLFEPRSRSWTRGDVEGFLLPAFTKRSLLRDRFDNFKLDHLKLDNMNSIIVKDHPIRIETFASESDKYVLTLNVQQFKPEELQVRITDNMISITAKHEDKKDEHNFSCQEFVRKHSLPSGVKAEEIKCDLSSDGVLTITAPKVVKKPLHNSERSIPIQHTGLPAIKV